MKKVMLLLVSLMLLAGPASATHFDEFTATADCEGWTASGHIYYSGAGVYVSYWVRLYEGSSMIYEVVDSVLVSYPDNLDFSLGEGWGMELCGDYTAVGHFALPERKGGDYRDFEISFTCECPPELCTFTPGFWKNHEEYWPVAGLTIGGTYYSKAQLLDIFDWPTNQHIERKLFHHLVAAMLNVEIGSAMGDIEDHIADANDFFEDYPLGTELTKFLELKSVRLKRPLEAFNEIECMDEEEFWKDGLTISPDGISSFKLNTTVEEKSWGAIKSIYK